MLEAEARPRVRALSIIYKEMPDRSDLAWKFIERREPGFERPMPAAQQTESPQVIRLKLHDGSPIHLIECEVIDERRHRPRSGPPRAQRLTCLASPGLTTRTETRLGLPGFVSRRIVSFAFGREMFPMRDSQSSQHAPQRAS